MRKTFEGIEQDWKTVQHMANHIQIDVTDGVFAGDGTFREIRRFKQLPDSQKIELHLMVQHPAEYTEAVIDVTPARCVFHLEAFSGGEHITQVYKQLRGGTPQTELALALNPDSPNQYLEEYLPLINYVLFMGYNPGWPGQPINPAVFLKISQFRDWHHEIPIAADGHVGLDTVAEYARAGARRLCANTAIFGDGDPTKNIEQLNLKAQRAILK